jgi:tripartite-type tricarboxylate transporter receptor subunit TctC
MKRRDFLATTGAGLLGLSPCLGALAQSWPGKPITWIYAYAAGGGGDPIARLLAEGLGKRLGQPIVVENKTGASGMIGATAAARAQPDGYTYLFGVSNELVINQSLYPKMTYAPEKDFAPVCLIVKLPLLLVASGASKIASIGDLIERARAQPGKLNYASPGSGTLQHLAAELLMRTAGIRMAHVPYRGVAAVTTDLLAGTVDVGFVGLPTALPHVRSGRLAALGVSTVRRSAAAPDLASLSEFPALKAFDLTQWFGLVAPTGTPAAVIERMHREIATLLGEEALRSRLLSQGAEPAVDTPGQFGEFMRGERERYARIVKEANVTVDQ